MVTDEHGQSKFEFDSVVALSLPDKKVQYYVGEHKMTTKGQWVSYSCPTSSCDWSAWCQELPASTHVSLPPLHIYAVPAFFTGWLVGTGDVDDFVKKVKQAEAYMANGPPHMLKGHPLKLAFMAEHMTVEVDAKVMVASDLFALSLGHGSVHVPVGVVGHGATGQGAHGVRQAPLVRAWQCNPGCHPAVHGHATPGRCAAWNGMSRAHNVPALLIAGDGGVP